LGKDVKNHGGSIQPTTKHKRGEGGEKEGQDTLIRETQEGEGKDPKFPGGKCWRRWASGSTTEKPKDRCDGQN